MYVLTGGAGFIGSAFLKRMNDGGIDDIIVVDHLGTSEKWKNLRGKSFREYQHKDEFLENLRRDRLPAAVDAVIHLGACSATTEQDSDYLMFNNVGYSSVLADYASQRGIRFIYASSGATYGDGAQGYSDKSPLAALTPLNPYGFSKHLFDLRMERLNFAPAAAGIKFFNVFGPNEYHKAGMRSVVLQVWEQAKTTGKVRLFKSTSPQYKDGEQMRDFIYVKDCCEVMWWLLSHPEVKGVFNLGSGKARTWNDLARAAFAALDLPPKIEYFDMPAQLARQYQNFTQAEMRKLAGTGCPLSFSSLEDGVKDYVQGYLERPNRYI